MTVTMFFQLVATTLTPAAVAILLHFLLKKFKKFKQLNFWIQQLIIGVLFAVLTIGSFYFGPAYQDFTYAGIQLEMIGVYGTATAVPLIAGLLFGWPSGIIAGFLGAIYRLFMNKWGIGDYLRASECIAVLLSGCLAALLRKTLFDNKKPKWIYGILIGLLCEVLHMSLSFLTIALQKDIYYAYGVVSQADIACTVSVSIAITLSLLGVALIERERVKLDTKSTKIAVKVQKWLGITFAVSLVFATGATVVAFMRKQERDNKAGIVNAIIDVERNLDNLSTQEMKPGTEDGQLNNVFHYRRVGEEGFFIVTNEQGKILATCIEVEEKYGYEGTKPKLYGEVFKFSDGKTLGEKPYIAFTDKERKTTTGSSFLGYIPFHDTEGKDSMAKYVCAYTKYTHPKNQQTYYICGLLPYDESIINAGLSIRITAYLEVLVFVAIFGVIYTFIKHVVIKNIHKINDDLSMITGGNLNVFVNVRENEEFASLSDDINHTVDTLKRYIDEANKRIDKELAFAKEIQYSSLPTIFPTNDKFDLYATMDTAKEVGGDFYDFFMIDKDRLMILIADVSGKGIPASLFMMRAKTLVKSLVNNQEYRLNDVISHVNNELCSNNAAGMFVTGWFGVLNITTGVLEFTNAGHNPPLIKRNGTFEYLKAVKNLVLAGMPDIPYKLESITLEPGDEILLYTDGVTEATSKEIKLYGEERLLNLVNSLECSSSKEFLTAIKADVDKFQEGVDQADDITMLSLRYKPAPSVSERSVLIKPRLSDISKAVDFLNENFTECHVPKEALARVDIALDELLSATITRLEKEEGTDIVVSFKVVSNVATITIVDNGKPFNIVEKIRDATANVEIKEENMPIFSMLLVKKVMHRVSYEYQNNRNILIIKKHIK